MKRLGMIVMAGLLVLGLAQCKKEQTNNTQSEGNVVRITLNVGPSTGSGTNNGSRVNVDPYPASGHQVTFENGDQIVVASNGAVVGTLEHNGTNFTGDINSPTEGQPLYFYFLGNKQGTVANGTTSCTVNISDQTTEAGLPVISMGQSTVNYSTAETNYTSLLYNKCSLMKFNVTTPSTAAICITGMNNTVTVDFSNPTDEGFTYGKDGDGLITMPGVTSENTTTWAIVLPQDALAEGEDGSVYTADDAYAGTRPQMDAIEMNTFLNAGVDLTAAFITAFTVDFNDGILPEGWTTIDADGDGYNWVLTNQMPAYGYNNYNNDGHNGTVGMTSGSYHGSVGPLTPDNYLVTPKVNLVQGSTFSFWACAQDYEYPAEHFGVFVSDNGTSGWTMVQEWTMTAKGASGNKGNGRDGNTRDIGNWYQYTVDLSAYAGEKYIAIRHFNCSDEFFLEVDDILLTVNR